MVGNKISPGQLHHKKDGTVVRTLWGELAWQLGGKEGYEMVREADETATNPGDNLKQLIQKKLVPLLEHIYYCVQFLIIYRIFPLHGTKCFRNKCHGML